MAIINVYAGRSARVRSGSPYNWSDETISALYNYQTTNADYLIYDYSIPAILRKKNILNITNYIFSVANPSSKIAVANQFETEWNEKTVTYNEVEYWLYWRPDRFRAELPAEAGKYTAFGPMGTVNSSIYPPINSLKYGFSISSDGGRSFYTSRGTNKPYAVVQYESVGGQSEALSPIQNAYVNAFENAEFFMGYTLNEHSSLDEVEATRARIQYRILGETEIKTLELPTAPTATVPANTFLPEKDYEWRAQVITNDDYGLTYSDWQQFKTHDALSNAPEIEQPKNEYVAVDEPIRFSWVHNIDTGTISTGADIEYRVTGGSFTKIGTVIGSDNWLDVKKDTVPAGTVIWRVRTKNMFGVPGEWTEATIVGYGRPPIPSITNITNSSRPTISWQSLGQVAYKLTIVKDKQEIYKTDEIGGAAKKHKVKVFLKNDSYKLKLQIKNADLNWSDEIIVDFVINVEGPKLIDFEVQVIGDAAEIKLQNGTDNKVFVLRDDVPIAKIVDGLIYIDYAGLGYCSYKLRIVDESDNYSDTDEKAVLIKVDSAKLAAVENLKDMIDVGVYKEAPYQIDSSTDMNISYVNNTGRKYPVAIYKGFIREQHVLRVSFLSTSSKVRFMQTIEKMTTYLYRDQWGNKWYCAIDVDSSQQLNHYSELTVTATVIDFVEKISYEEVNV